MRQFITVDMKATEQFDLAYEQLMFEARAQKWILERLEGGGWDEDAPKSEAEKKKILADLVKTIKKVEKDAKSIKKGAGPQLVIGYIPAARMSSLSLVDREDAEKVLESNRELCRLGVTGWANVKGQDGKATPFNADVMLDTIERAGMLYTVAGCVRRYNSLQEDTAKK